MEWQDILKYGLIALVIIVIIVGILGNFIV